MTRKTLEDTITADGEYYFAPRLAAGIPRLLELSGGFGGGTATLGYVSKSGAFVAFLDDIGGSPITLTTEGGIEVVTPSGGRFALSLDGATSASLQLTVTEVFE